ncbi:Muniscin C-terminal mu homology domain-containing protein [Lineolata rhizophorae]|uniref:Muniscin C-terminal mu homology domain-containing protein n=1 Tax=Lineolata rhizophorae TaxID=578093 RepID=A0A6A6NU18_9PEZI|nr:Muniscin C-terminal mu homology domain-containing protein [Lineolata rhizophorae]
MDRQEYPALLASLQPGQAVTVLNDRIRHITRLNTDVADWLQERRRIEEGYAQALRKLSRKQPPDESSELGVFSTPWQKIVSSTETLADSHHTLAQRIEADVERPLRDFAASNGEMQAMSNISGNLASLAKDVETAQKKADKLKDKGVKAATDKVASAASDVENATSQWESQAPYVFEKLQAIDESRCNHLRDVLTQFQTHEVDQVDRDKVTTEQCLNVLLNIETADEIKTFTLKVSSGRPPRTERQKSRSGPPPNQSSVSSPPAPAPTINADDGSSQRSGSVQEQKHGGFSGLKRLGTVLRSRRHSTHPYGRGASPERKSSSNIGGLSPFGSRSARARDLQPPSEQPRPPSPLREQAEVQQHGTPRASESSSSPRQTRSSADNVNGSVAESSREPAGGSTNGATPTDIPKLQEPLQPTPASGPSVEPQKDSEGFSVPQSATDAITKAEEEAASEAPAPQFKVDIRNAPIQEEDGDAETALANVANTLRAQATMPRKSGTIRGRRDVRTTMFVPSPQQPELSSSESSVPQPPASPGTAPSPPPSTGPLQSPFKQAHRSAFLGDDHAASDTQSVRSGRSLSSAASATIKHPEMHSPGLNSSIVESVSAWFEGGSLTKAAVIGELALAYNPVDLSAPFGSELIRLENFSILEKVAPNPAFIESMADKPGTYTIKNLSSITKTAVAFKYQVHLDEGSLASYAPLQLTTQWKTEPTSVALIISYSLNPAFSAKAGVSSIRMSNVVILAHLEGSMATSCQSKPQGTFSRKRSLLYWHLGDVKLVVDQPDKSDQSNQLRARFRTESEGKAGNVEGRWDIEGEDAAGLGSGLSVSQQSTTTEAPAAGADASDPFADEGSSANPEAAWKDVSTVRRITSGTYVSV